MKTKAAILIEQNKPLDLDEVEIPALRYGQVLVEVKVSRICGSQLGEIAGVKGPDREQQEERLGVGRREDERAREPGDDPDRGSRQLAVEVRLHPRQPPIVGHRPPRSAGR